MRSTLASNGAYCLRKFSVLTFPVMERIGSAYSVFFLIEIHNKKATGCETASDADVGSWMLRPPLLYGIEVGSSVLHSVLRQRLLLSRLNREHRQPL